MMKPFLKWAGNKYRIIHRISKLLPAGKRLIEPFAGSGAVFLNTDYPSYLLTDNNPDLIGLFQILQGEGVAFIDYCQEVFADNNTGQRFYELRELFNSTQDKRLKAALFVYLNRHCFNGLCRYNNSGRFNVPFGRYQNPRFPRQEMLWFHQKAATATFVHADFIQALEAAQPGDVVYCDPPYVPLSTTANFANYSGFRFGQHEQQCLATQAEQLAARGITVLISNHQTPWVRKLYSNAKLQRFKVPRTISCRGDKRQAAPELLAIFAAHT